MRHLFLLPLLLTAAPLLPAAEPAERPALPAGWTAFSPKDKSFSVWLPDGGRRQERERAVRLRRGRVRINTVSLEANDGASYSASTFILPLSMVRKISTQQRIEIARDAFISDTDKITSEKTIRLGPLSGREYLVKTGKGVSRLRLFAAGGRFYQVGVAGSDKQVESKDAGTFLDSYRPSAALVNPGVGGPAGQPAPAGKAPAGAVREVKGEVDSFVAQAVKDKRLAEVDVKGFTLTKNAYRDAPADGGVLVGLQVSEGKFLNNPIVVGVRPIFRTAKGEKLGAWHGTPSDDPVVVKAKPSYVVGGISVRAGLTLDGLSLTYMKFDGGKIDAKDRYKSHWVGGNGGNPAEVGGQGVLFVGICGHVNDDKKACAIGLLAALSPEG